MNVAHHGRARWQVGIGKLRRYHHTLRLSASGVCPPPLSTLPSGPFWFLFSQGPAFLCRSSGSHWLLSKLFNAKLLVNLGFVGVRYIQAALAVFLPLFL